ncbi:hypothetical protein SynA1524_00086 [Synechococcus sp. A15-24]|nr:hypothetical protein SynA1524_00086 [Synechococcus sp. A15-24]
MPNAVGLLQKNFHPESIQIIRIFDSSEIISDGLTLGNCELWKSRILELSPILIDNANSQGDYISNSSTYVKKTKTFFLNISNEDVLNLPKWLLSRILSPGEISVLLKHYCALLHIAEGKESHGLIAEDDILEQPDTLELFNEVKKFIDAKNPDYIDVAGGAGLHCKNDNSSQPQLFVQVLPPRTRTNAGYVVSKRLAKIIVQKYLPLCFPIDWQLQYILYKYSNMPISCYWMQKTLYLHGSETVSYQSWRD